MYYHNQDVLDENARDMYRKGPRPLDAAQTMSLYFF